MKYACDCVTKKQGLVVFALAAVGAMSGCASTPPPTTGFLSDYTRLEKLDTGKMRYISSELREYSAFMVDPVEMRAKGDVLTADQKAEVARYMHGALSRVLQQGQYTLASQQGVGVARLRVAITDIQEAKWYMNVHPGTKVTGAGRAGASMEAEVVDSVSGAQLAAAIRSGKGTQFELNPFSTIDDVKDVIDQWAKDAGERLRELREAS